MPNNIPDSFLINDKEAQILRGESERYPDEVKLIPMGLAKNSSGNIGVASCLSCMCVTDPTKENYGQLNMDVRNPVAMWECDPDASFPGTRSKVRRSWAALFVKSDISESFRNWINSILRGTPWANGRPNEVKDQHDEPHEDSEKLEEALANIGETE